MKFSAVLVAVSLSTLPLGAIAQEMTDPPAVSPDVSTQDGPPVDLAPEIMQRLSAEQLRDYLMARERAKVDLARIENPHDDVVAIGISALFFITLGLSVLVALLLRHRKEHMMHQTLRAMIEEGQHVPVELLKPVPLKASDLRRGLVFIGAGLGTCLFGLIAAGSTGGMWSVGIIPILIGVGYLLTWWLERRENRFAQLVQKPEL